MKQPATATYSISLVTQGKHKFYTLTMPSDVLAKTCTVDTRADDPILGFQRKLEERRARDIARYIDEGLGTIPCSIVLSAQSAAALKYNRTRRSITFNLTSASFLIIDGQHRVYGFALAKSSLRVPVVIYNDLTRVEECRLFIDINTKQRPVPNELLLDIKRLAETESDDESKLGQLFDRFANSPDSPLVGLMSPAARASGRISRVTFNSALRSVWSTFAASDTSAGYRVLSAYLHAWTNHLRDRALIRHLTNPTLFRGIVRLFPDVAQRVEDRAAGFSVDQFASALAPLFGKLSATQVRSPGSSHVELYTKFSRILRQQFTITS